MTDLHTRFQKFVGEPLENGCIPWLGCKAKSGHGRISIDNKPYPAHRLSYILYKDNIPDGLHVLHGCDNGWCVNPQHLHLGTQTDNMREMIERGRNKNPPVKKGENHGCAKLTQQQVDEIKKRLPTMKPYGRLIKLAKEYNVSSSTIHLISKNKIWNSD